MSKQQNIKTKLDQLMKELNNNLPEINFEDTENENDEMEIKESDLNMFRDDDDEEFIKLNSLLNNDKFDFENEILNQYEDNNDIVTSKDLDELKDLKLNFSLTTFHSSNESNSSTAEKITKNMFNGKNSKLSMEKFNTLNIDDALNTFNRKNTDEIITSSTKWYASLIKNPTSLNSASISNNDENILKKLAEMSMQISNDSELKGLNLKTGTITSAEHSMISLRNINSIFLDTLTNNSNSSSNPFDLIEKELKQKTVDKSNDLFNQDLENFLKSHNIKDGNMIETRRIDLRASQHQDHSKKDPKEKLKSLFDNIATQTNQNKNDNKNMKFINQASSSSDESNNTSDSDEENESNEKLLWIERYRRQKLNLHNKNNKIASN
jgi:hypothetical protein